MNKFTTKEIFIGNLIVTGLEVQHLSQFIFSSFLYLMEKTWKINDYKEFNWIIYFLTIMHFLWLLITQCAYIFEKIG